MQNFMFKAFTKEAIDSIRTSTEEERRWMEFNYPPVLRLIYFNTESLIAPVKKTVDTLNFSWLIVLLIQIISFFNCIL